MLERLKSMFSSGILSEYEVTGRVKDNHLYNLSSGRCRRSLRPVLIKEYTPEGIEVEKKLDTLFRSRPLADTLLSLRHPRIVRTVGTQANGAKRIEIMAAPGGPSLLETLGTGDVEPDGLLEAVIEAGEGIAHLHSLGLLHRMLRPEGIALGDGGAMLTDLSLLMDAAKAKCAATMSGVTRYSAPEIIRRAPADVRSDVFSLGAVLYEGLGGMPIFANAAGFERLLRVMNSKAENISQHNAHVAPELENVVMKAVARNPAERYANMSDFLEALRNAPLPEKLGFHAPAYAA
jgi:serine/threonine-protein kinase